MNNSRKNDHNPWRETDDCQTSDSADLAEKYQNRLKNLDAELENVQQQVKNNPKFHIVTKIECQNFDLEKMEKFRWEASKYQATYLKQEVFDVYEKIKR